MVVFALAVAAYLTMVDHPFTVVCDVMIGGWPTFHPALSHFVHHSCYYGVSARFLCLHM